MMMRVVAEGNSLFIDSNPLNVKILFRYFNVIFSVTLFCMITWLIMHAT